MVTLTVEQRMSTFIIEADGTILPRTVDWLLEHLEQDAIRKLEVQTEGFGASLRVEFTTGVVWVGQWREQDALVLWMTGEGGLAGIPLTWDGRRMVLGQVVHL